MFILGCLAFAFFILSDLNDLKIHSRALIPCFPAGAVILCLSVGGQLEFAAAPLVGVWRWAVLFLGAVFAALLIYTLFFAFPASEAYAAPGKKRRACTRGVYALCRHPGVLWLFGLMLCLWAGAGLDAVSVMVYTVLNIALAFFEDRFVFPGLMDGYAEYKNTVPFLLPSPRSVRRCITQIYD